MSETNTPSRDYSNLTREELEARLDAAEDVCVMFAWSPARHDSDRDAATHELWRRWERDFGGSSDRKDNSHLTDAVVAELAWRRQEVRGRTLAAIRDSAGRQQ